MIRSISRTDPFRALQKSIGGATLYLNTVAVALELTVPVAAATPGSLHISWTAPSTEGKRRSLASQTRAFVLRSVLVTACDAIDSFVREFVRTDWLSFPQSVIDIATKATTKPNKSEWSVFERLKAITTHLAISDVDSGIGLISLASRWRNALVHTGTARFELDASVRSLLKTAKAKQDLGVKARFDIDATLRRFDDGEPPSLKDVTTVLAFTQEICRRIDQEAIQKVAGTAEQVEALVVRALRQHFRTRGELDEFWGIHRTHEWVNGAANASYAIKESLFDRSSEYQEKWNRKFSNLIDAKGFSKAKYPVSHEVSERYIGFLSSMSARQFSETIGLA